jgi:exopolysaccharide production protein ExoZ
VNTKNIENIQALRGVAALLVLLSHASLYESRTDSNQILPNSLFELGGAGVDLFFVISGYVMMLISGFGSSGIVQARNFFTRRAARIYPLYWFFTLVVILIVSVQPQLINREGGISQLSYWKSFFLIPDVEKAPLVGQGWTLIHEMYFYIAFSVIVIFKNKTRYYVIGLWVLLLILFNSVFEPPNTPAFKIITNQLTFEFIFGCLVAILQKMDIMNWGKTAFFGGIAFLCMNPEHMDASRVLWFGLPSTLIVYGAVAMEKKQQLVLPLWLRKTGDISYSLYLSHVFVLSVCLKVWKLIESEGFLDNIIAIFAMFLFSWITGFIVYQYFEYPVMKYSKLLIKRMGW